MNARKYIKLFFALFLVAAQVTVHAQSKVLGDYVISDPQTWSFMKYGGQTPDLYTGTVRAEIPIYTYKDRDFEIPLSLRYASNGFMPNVQANYVGLGWTLDVGGCITRKVNGIRDDEEVTTRYLDPSGKTCGHYIQGFYRYSSTNHNRTIPILDRDYSGLDVVGANVSSEYCFRVDGLYYETKPDIFSFSFLGYSGKYVIKEDGSVMVFDSNIPSGEITIDLTMLDLTQFKSSITIHLGNGYRYDFGGLIGRYDESIYDESISPVNEGQTYITKGDIWYLKRITAPNGRQVTFSYDINESSTITPRGGRTAFSAGWHDDSNSNSFYYNGYSEWNDYYLELKSHVAQLSRVEIDGVCAICFSYGSRPKEKAQKGSNAPFELQTPGCLTEIRVIDEHSSEASAVLDCSLGYIYGVGNPVMMLSSVTIRGLGTYRMNYYGESDSFPYQGCVKIDHWGYYNSNSGNTIGDLMPTVTTSGDYTEIIGSQNRNPDSNKAILGLLERLEYPTGGWTEYEYEPRVYEMRVFRGESTMGRPLLTACSEDFGGGLRIKSITDHSSPYESSKKEYSYGLGIMLSFPRYSHKVQVSTSMSDIYVNNISTTSNGLMMDDTYIEYGVVTERFSDSSYVVHKYRNYQDTPDCTDAYSESQVWKDYPVRPAPYVIPSALTAHNYFKEFASRNVLRGKPAVTEYYSPSGMLMKRELYNYADDDSRYVSYAGITAGGRYEGRYLLPYCDLTSVTTEIFSPDANVVSNTVSYSYNSLRQKKSESLTSSDGVTRRKNRFYVQDIYPGARTSAESAMVARKVTAFPIYESESVTDAAGTWLVSARHNVYTQSGNMFLLSTVGEGQVAGRQQYANTIPASIPYRTVASYGSFNSQGRPCSLTDSNGIQSLLLWGYGGLYPVALIANCTIQSFSSSGISLAADLGWSGLVGAQEPRVRSIPGASVTTWKYLPFVGVSEKIGPDGRKTTYDYDDYGRLVSVKDTDDEKVEEYHYNIITE